jgi:hypothetical protein
MALPMLKEYKEVSEIGEFPSDDPPKINISLPAKTAEWNARLFGALPSA